MNTNGNGNGHKPIKNDRALYQPLDRFSPEIPLRERLRDHIRMGLILKDIPGWNAEDEECLQRSISKLKEIEGGTISVYDESLGTWEEKPREDYFRDKLHDKKILRSYIIAAAVLITALWVWNDIKIVQEKGNRTLMSIDNGQDEVISNQQKQIEQQSEDLEDVKGKLQEMIDNQNQDQ